MQREVNSGIVTDLVWDAEISTPGELGILVEMQREIDSGIVRDLGSDLESHRLQDS